MRGKLALEWIARHIAPGDALDIGCGTCDASRFLRDGGWNVTAVDIKKPNGDCAGIETRKSDALQFLRGEWERQWDLIWCSHTLEHVLDTHLFLTEVREHLRNGGWLALVVPPFKSKIVGGHVSLWNAGLVLYRLVLAGIDCRDTHIRVNGSDINVIVQYKRIDTMPELKFENGDIDLLKAWLPPGLKHGSDSFEGNISLLNW